MNQKTVPFRISILSKEEILLGASIKVQHLAEGFTEDKQIIISKYVSVNIGLIFIMISFTGKLYTQLGN